MALAVSPVRSAPPPREPPPSRESSTAAPPSIRSSSQARVDSFEPPRKSWKGGLPKAIVFDMDSTLVYPVNSKGERSQGVHRLKRSFDALRLRDPSMRLSARLLRSPDHWFLHRFMSGKKEMEGASQLLDWLTPRGVRCAVASNSLSAIAQFNLRLTELEHNFEVVVCSDDPEVGKRKPAPDVLLKALERMGIRPEEAMVVGNDLAEDGGAARAAGIFFVGLGVDGDKRFDRLDDLRGWLAKLEQRDRRAAAL